VQIQAETVEGLPIRDGRLVYFKAGQRPIDFARLRFEHFQDHIGEEFFGKIQPRGKFHPDGVYTAAGRLFQPFPEAASPRLVI